MKFAPLSRLVAGALKALPVAALAVSTTLALTAGGNEAGDKAASSQELADGTPSIEELYEKLRTELPAITVLSNAIQPRVPAEGESRAQRRYRDRLVNAAIYSDVARLHHMLEGLKAKKEGRDPKPHCDAMMSYLDEGFTHIEGIEEAPLRTTQQLHGVCMNENQWVITMWEMSCIQPTVLDDRTVHLTVRYWQNQSDYTGHPEHKQHPRYLDLPEDQRPFFVPRIAVRTLVRTPEGRMVIARHSAFDVKGKAVLGPQGEPLTEATCMPLPAITRRPAEAL